MYRKLAYAEAIAALGNSEITYLHGPLMRDFVAACRAVSFDPDLSSWIEYYLNSDVYVDKDGIPRFGYSTWRRSLAIFGIDFALVPSMDCDPVALLEDFTGHLPDDECAVEMTIFKASVPVAEDRALAHTIHYSQTSDNLLQVLKSSQRNEVSKCLQQHADKILVLSADLPDELLRTQHQYWQISPGDDEPDYEHAAYMVMLWIFSSVCARHGRGQVLSAYDPSGQWVFSCALNRIKGHFQFTSYAQHPDHRMSRSGTFMLYSALLRIHEAYGPSQVYLTCPAFGMPDAYEGYKKQLSSGKERLPSLYAARHDAAAPYFHIPTKQWVLI